MLGNAFQPAESTIRVMPAKAPDFGQHPPFLQEYNLDVALDSGSALHLRSADSVSNLPVYEGDRVTLSTANDTITNSKRCLLPADGIFPQREACILNSTPNVESLGQLCMIDGFSFVWVTKELPILITPSGEAFQVQTEHFVPIMNSPKPLTRSEFQSAIRLLIRRTLAVAATVQLGDTLHVIEFCCFSDSLLGQYAHEFGIQVHRYSLSFANLATAQGRQLAINYAEKLPPGTSIFGSIPCAPWSSIQNLCEENARLKGTQEHIEYLEKLQRAREESLYILETFKLCCRVIVQKHDNITSEQPKGSGLLKREEYQQFEAEFGLKRVPIEQCAFDLVCPKSGLPLHKPHLLSTTLPSLQKADKAWLCPGCAKHGDVIGGNAELSGRYTPKLVRAILQCYECDSRTTLKAGPAEEIVAVEDPPIEEEVEEVPEDQLIRLQNEAQSTHHLALHLPYNPLCKWCQIGKQKRRQHRRYKVPRERAKQFGDLIRGDDIIADSDVTGDTCALILQDDATQIIQAYPAKNRSAERVEESIRHFLGPTVHAAIIFHSDNAPEFGKACHSLGIVHRPGTPNDPQTHALEERNNQHVIQGCRAVLAASGLPTGWWPYAIKYFAVANTCYHIGKDGKTAWERKHSEPFPGPLVPFGARVTFVAHSQHKMQPTGTDCIFLGWNITPGCKFSGEFTIMPVKEYAEGEWNPQRSRDVQVTQELTFPCRELNDKALLLKYVDANILSSIGIGTGIDLQELYDDGTLIPLDSGEPAEPQAQQPEAVADQPQPAPEVAAAPPPENWWPPRRGSSRPPYIDPKFWPLYGPSARAQEIARYKESLKAANEPPAPVPNFQEGGSSSSTDTPVLQAIATLITSVAELLSSNGSIQRALPTKAKGNKPAFHSVPVPKCRRTLEQLASEMPAVERGPVHLNPFEEEHRAALPRVLSLVTRQITRRDPEWNSESGRKAIFEEVTARIKGGVFSPEGPIEFTEAKLRHPGAHFTKLMTILGIKFSELPPDAWKYKCRIVLRGDHIWYEDGSSVFFDELSASPASLELLRSIVIYSLLQGTPPSTADAVGAYMQHVLTADDGPPTYVLLAPEDLKEGSPWIAEYPQLRSMKRPCLLLVRLLYGHPKASQIWEKHLHQQMLDLGWNPMPNVNQVYYKDWKEGSSTDRLVFGAYVDDCVLGGRNNRKAWPSIRKVVETTEPEDLQRLLAVTFSFTPDRPGVTFMKQEMHQFCLRVVDKYISTPGSMPVRKVDTPLQKTTPAHWQDETWQAPGVMKEFSASILMTAYYPARMYRADLVFPIGFLARFITKWTVLCDHMLHRLMCYIHSTANFSLYSEIGSGDKEVASIHILGYPDADHGECPLTNRSTSGNAVVVRGELTTCLTHFSSKRQGCTSTSTPEAEIISACKILREYLVPLQSLWSNMLSREVECVVKEDNEAAIKIFIAGYSLAMRHLERTHRYNLSQASEILRLPGFRLEYCNTKEQLGDLLTKVLDKTDLQRGLDLAGIRP